MSPSPLCGQMVARGLKPHFSHWFCQLSCSTYPPWSPVVAHGRPCLPRCLQMPPRCLPDASRCTRHCLGSLARVILFYPILFYLILFYPVLFYPILFYPILFYPILFYPILFYAKGLVLGTNTVSQYRVPVPCPSTVSQYLVPIPCPNIVSQYLFLSLILRCALPRAQRRVRIPNPDFFDSESQTSLGS